MPIGAGKLRVLIATTNGPVEVLLLTEEDAAIGRCVACIGGTTETADIAAAYHAFVVRPTGIIESRFGHSCYRLDVSARIDAGSSWQLGVLAAHALLSARRLAQENDTADAVLWATGSVRPVDLTVGAVSHVPEKLANSLERLKQERAAGRHVLIALPAANADEVPAALASELTALGIDTLALKHVEPLFDAMAMAMPDGPGKATTTGNVPEINPGKTPGPPPAATPPALPSATVTDVPRRRWIVPAAAAAVALLAAAGTTAVLLERKGATDDAALPVTHLAAGPTAVAPAPVSLVPEQIPFVTAQDRARIRDEYMTAPDYKALATSLVKIAFVSGQPTQEAADRAAMEACKQVNASIRNETDAACDLYASGNVVVTRRSRPPLPPEPWVTRNPSVERRFVAAEMPLATPGDKEQINKDYPGLTRSKALVASPDGNWWYSSGLASPHDAMRRSLERCGYVTGNACMVVAIDDTFVVPIPTLAKVVGFYRPGMLFGVKPETVDDTSRRLAAATDGWNAVAIGASGDVGIAVGGTSERSAIDGALADCAEHDHNCRLAVLGPFLVETTGPQGPRQPGEQTRPPAPPGPAQVALVPDLVPFVSTQDRVRIRDEYMTAPDYKALATNVGMVAIISGQPSQDEADRAALKKCHELNPGQENQCEVYASGNVVVSRRERPRMPPEPWVVRNSSVERPFAAALTPLVSEHNKQTLANYSAKPRPKAVALAPNGFWAFSSKRGTADDVIRQSLEVCGQATGQPCVVMAVDDTFVIPIPTLAKAVGLYRPDALSGASPAARDEVARRLAGAPNAWNAVAVGAGGDIGIAVSANSEQSALDGALADCAKHDHDCRLAVLGPFMVEAIGQGQPQSQPPAQKPSPNQPQAQIEKPSTPPAGPALVADAVPFITRREKERIRDEYMPAPDYKALAISHWHLAVVTSRPSQEAADRAAMEACEKLATPSLSKAEQECDLYASGNVVVTRQNPPLMPAQPWVVRNRAVEQPFDANLMPMIDTSGKERIAKRYPHAARSKAFVMAPGKGWAYTAQSEPDDAVRRSLERCGATASSPCMVVAVDDTFVVPIPTLAKAIGFYRPDGLVGVTPAVRDEVARRLASAPNAWNAVAVGAGGNVGIALDADSELSALDGAMADCAKHDRNCRIAVMGPFLVELAEPEKQRTATP